MSDLSLKDRLLRFLKRNPDWINGGELERLAMSVGFKGSTAGRELRWLSEHGHIEKEERKGRKIGSIWYRVKVKKYEPSFK